MGRHANAYPNLVRRVAGARHGIGGHTWDHVDLRYLSSSAFSRQVDGTNGLLARLPGPDRVVRCVRPPFGAEDARPYPR